jgi:hypothetical protein
MRILALGTLLTTLAACTANNQAVQCKISADCNQFADGSCDPNPETGNLWCSYPDSTCPQGRRWTETDTGDGIGGACQGDNASTPDAGPPVQVDVQKSGYGKGAVIGTASSQTVVDCSTTDSCSAVLASGTSLTLTATTAPGDVFYGWQGGGCAGTGPCTITITEATTVTATFDQCDRASIDNCDEAANLYERCDTQGQATTTLACPAYCSPTAKKCVDIDPSDDPTTKPLQALMDVLAGTGENLSFPSTCTPSTCMINTTTGAITGATTGSSAPSTAVTGSGRVFRVETFSLEGKVKVTGYLPLVILANGAVTIRGVLDASADLEKSGPGSQDSAAACAGHYLRSTTTLSAGAGGGGRNSAGAAGGGAYSITGAAGGAIQNEPTLIPLLGGCYGGWVDESGGSRVTWWGGGGGAVQLVSRASVSILGGGVIDVSGGGGPSGDESHVTDVLGGTGGGSGGSILIEAPVVVLDGAGVVLSAKGGGGSAEGARGFNGADGGYTAGPAPGGANPLGGSGGNGGTETTAPTPGASGGGGGGAVGLCRINTRAGVVTQQNGAAVRCVRPSNTKLAERLLP